MEAAVESKEGPKGGMSVPHFGDFANVNPSTVRELKWWARELRTALDEESKP
jgi:hypothetical protein